VRSAQLKKEKSITSLWLDNRWFARASFLAKTHRVVYGQTHSGQPGLVSRDRTASAGLRSNVAR
jgi:hypothetical protein